MVLKGIGAPRGRERGAGGGEDFSGFFVRTRIQSFTRFVCVVSMASESSGRAALPSGGTERRECREPARERKHMSERAPWKGARERFPLFPGSFPLFDSTAYSFAYCSRFSVVLPSFGNSTAVLLYRIFPKHIPNEQCDGEGDKGIYVFTPCNILCGGFLLDFAIRVLMMCHFLIECVVSR